MSALVDEGEEGVDELLKALEVAVAVDDQLQVARIRRRLQELALQITGEEETEGDEEQNGFSDSPVPLGSEPVERHLRLVTGGISADELVPQQPQLRVSDLVGVATVKRALQDIVDEARNPSGDHSWLGGALFYGPPSCGKEFAVNAVAGELGASLWQIDFLQNWQHEGVRGVLERVTTECPSGGAIVFLNHLDHENAAPALKPNLELLDEMRSRSKTLILGSATLPWLVDAATARPERLARPVLVLPPDAPSRRTFIYAQLAGRAQAEEADIDWIVKRTDGHSFADLKLLVDTVIENTAGATTDHSEWRNARRDVPPSCAEWLDSAGHHALISESGGLYDDLLNYFRSRQKR